MKRSGHRFVVQALAGSALISWARLNFFTRARLKSGLQTSACCALLFFGGCGKRSAQTEPASDAARSARASSSSRANESPAPAPAEMDYSKTLDRLTQAVRKYAAETRSAPKSLDELVAAGYLPESPVAPPGKKYAIDDQLRVRLK